VSRDAPAALEQRQVRADRMDTGMSTGGAPGPAGGDPVTREGTGEAWCDRTPSTRDEPAGRQQTAVTVHHAGTPEATVVVQVGRAVIYLHSMPAADRFANIWQGAQPDAAQLRRNRNLERGRRTGPLAIAEPSIVVHAAGTPVATVRLARGARLEPTFLGIQVGNLALRLFDQAAFTATAEAVLQAQRAAREHLKRLKRADPTRGERLRGEPALPRRTTAAPRDEPGLARRPASVDPNTADPGRALPGRARPDRAHPAARARAPSPPVACPPRPAARQRG
jgi:hypothetical protein